MGHATSWIAIAGDEIDDALKILQLSPGEGIAQIEDHHNDAQSFSLAKAEWTIVITGKTLIEPSKILLAELSANKRIIACSMEEHCMYSEAAEWHNGRCIWFACHHGDGCKKPADVTTGTLPDSYAKIFSEKKNLESAQKKREVDFLFEVPLATAQSITGFRYDAENPAYDDAGYRPLLSTKAGSDKTKPSIIERILQALAPTRAATPHRSRE